MIRGKNLRELQARLAASLDRKAGQLVAGSISPSEFITEARELLAFGHARAAVLGSFRAQRHNPPSDVAIRVAAEAARSQDSFLFGFLRDLAEGKYRPKSQGGRGATQRMARFAMYSMRLAGTGNQSFLDTLLRDDPNLEVKWVRHAIESCEDCRREASIGWRLASDRYRD